MKNWIQDHYFKIRYNPQNIPLPVLRRIVWAAWEAVPETYIVDLYRSWWRRCQAVIDANGVRQNIKLF